MSRYIICCYSDNVAYYNGTKVASNKSRLLPNIILQDTQTVQLCTMNTKQKLFPKVIKDAGQFGLA